jgi:hypothetical protein
VLTNGHALETPGLGPEPPRVILPRVNFARVLDLVATRLDEGHHRFALAGALALHAHGISRATQDLDLVTEAGAQPGIIEHLESLGYQTLHRSEGYSNHFHDDAEMGRIDFIYIDATTSTVLFPRCDRTLKLGAREVMVPCAEHLVAMKVQAMKNDPRRSFKELADIQSLMETARVDRSRARIYFERAGLLERYRELERLL